MLKDFLSPGTIPRLWHSPVCTDRSSCLGGGGTSSPDNRKSTFHLRFHRDLLYSGTSYLSMPLPWSLPFVSLHSSVAAWSIFKAVNSLKAESCGCITWFSLVWRVFHVLQGLASVCRGQLGQSEVPQRLFFSTDSSQLSWTEGREQEALMHAEANTPDTSLQRKMGKKAGCQHDLKPLDSSPLCTILLPSLAVMYFCIICSL